MSRFSKSTASFLGAVGLGVCLSLAAYGEAVAAPSGGGGSATPSVGSTGGGSSTQKRADVKEDYRDGLSSFEAGDWAAAEDSFEKVVKGRKDDGDARAYLGMTQVKLEKWKDARKSLEKAIDDNTVLPGAWENLGLVYLHFDEADKAGEQLTALGQLKDGCADPCPNPDELQRAYDALQTAITDYGEGGEPQALLSPSDADRSYQTAVRHVNAGDYWAAIDVLRTMYESDPENADVLNYLGFSHRKLGDYDAALRYYQTALAINPNHAGANEYLGELYIELGQLESAEKQLAKLDQICTYACTQYEDLKQLIDNYKAGLDG